MIVLRAKDIPFEVTYIDLRDKPDWFLAISPHGKVPVLQVDGTPLFESNAIAEYLDEAEAPRLHPEDLLQRARHRAWTDFVPTFAPALSGLYYAAEPDHDGKRMSLARTRLDKLEDALAGERAEGGPFFSGPNLCLVDAAYAPFLQRFRFVEQWLRCGVMDDYPLISAWTDALLASEVVRGSVPEAFFDTFTGNLARRGAFIAEHMNTAPPARAGAPDRASGP